MSSFSNINGGGPELLISTARQVRALASPMRQEVIDVLEAAGPLSVAELAEQLGRAPDSLYFHLRKLERVGLVVEVERRKDGRHVAVVYDVPGRPVRIVPGDIPAKALDAVISGALRLGQRDYRRGLKDPAARADGPMRDLWGGRAKGWLSDAELVRVNQLIAELQRVLRSGRPGEGRRGVGFSFALAPSGGGKRSKRNTGGKRTQRGDEPREGRA